MAKIPGYDLSWCQTSVLFPGHGLERDEGYKTYQSMDVSGQISKGTLRGQAVFSRVRIPVRRPWKEGII